MQQLGQPVKKLKILMILVELHQTVRKRFEFQRFVSRILINTYDGFELRQLLKDWVWFRVLNIISVQQFSKMKKVNNSKALYHFTKKQKNKYSTSTKDLNDSLDLGQISPSRKSKTNEKKLHQRTQSCPSIENPIKIVQPLQEKGDTSRNSDKQQTTRSQGGKLKAIHRHCHSQASIQSLSLNQCNLSIENLSSILYRKNSNETSLKKLGFMVSGKEKKFAINSQLYSKARLQHQMKKYELNEELVKLQKSTQGISMKQQILQNLLSKFQFDLVSPTKETIS